MISAVIVNYEAREQLTETLHRLEPFRPELAEVVVVDNASRDGSVERVRKVFPWCRLLALDHNPGFGTANNLAARECRGESLLLLNSDAWLTAGALAEMVAELDRHPGIGAVAPSLYYPDGRRQFAWAPETGVWGEAVQKLRNRWESNPLAHRAPPRWLWRVYGPAWLTAAVLLVRRSAFEDVGGFDERFFLYFEDVDLCRRLRRAGWRLSLAPRARAFHIKGASQRPATGEIAYRRSQRLYYHLHRPRWEQAVLDHRLHDKARNHPDPELRRALADLLEEGPRDG